MTSLIIFFLFLYCWKKSVCYFQTDISVFSVWWIFVLTPVCSGGPRGRRALEWGLHSSTCKGGSQPGRRSGLKAGCRSAGQQAGGRAGGVRIEGRGRGGEKGRERREEVVGKKEHQELGRALDRLHTGRVQTNNRRLRRRHRWHDEESVSSAWGGGADTNVKRIINYPQTIFTSRYTRRPQSFEKRYSITKW